MPCNPIKSVVAQDNYISLKMLQKLFIPFIYDIINYEFMKLYLSHKIKLSILKNQGIEKILQLFFM